MSTLAPELRPYPASYIPVCTLNSAIVSGAGMAMPGSGAKPEAEFSDKLLASTFVELEVVRGGLCPIHSYVLSVFPECPGVWYCHDDSRRQRQNLGKIAIRQRQRQDVLLVG